jgi:hypothetical protein
MHLSDNFEIVVPMTGRPILMEAGADLSPYVGGTFTRLNKQVALNSGRVVQGTIFAERTLTASDELDIHDKLNAHLDAL